MRIPIDPNVRVSDNCTFALLSDADGPLAPFAEVTVVEEESGGEGPGVVRWIDHDKGIVYLEVDWPALGRSMREGAAGAGVLPGDESVGTELTNAPRPPPRHITFADDDDPADLVRAKLRPLTAEEEAEDAGW